MKHVGKHPNIVNLIACCTVKPPLLLVMEYIGCGDLVSFFFEISKRKSILIFRKYIFQLQYLRRLRAKLEGRSEEADKSITSTMNGSSKTTSSRAYINPSDPQKMRLPSATDSNFIFYF